MRLLYLTADPGIPVFGGKGASIHVQALASSLQALGHEVTIASPRLEPGTGRLSSGVGCIDIPAVRPRECSSPREVAAAAEQQAQVVTEVARAERIEAIYERYSLASCAGARASISLGLPLVLEVNAPLRDEERRFRQLAHESAVIAAEQETFAVATRIFAVSSALAGWLTSVGVDQGRVEVLANAPPERGFAPKPAICEHDQVVAGFAGGLKLWHGVETLVRGFELALARGARMRLEIVGRGPADEIVDRAALPADRLIRLGHLPHDQALDTLERWDVGLAPYTALEGFYFSPLKLSEYMAAGLCPVVSDVGELAHTIERGRAGVVVAPGDPEALADALVMLDRDRVLLRALGERARQAALARPSWTDNARRVIEAIEATRLPVPAGAGNAGR